MASGRSIRFKISTLLVIPLISLVALWAFAASTTTGQALNLLKVETFWSGVINHTDALVTDLQNERLASAERLAGVATDPAALSAARAKADKTRKALTDSVLSQDVRDSMTAEMKTRLQGVLAAVDNLSDTRRRVDEGKLTGRDLITRYATVSDAVHLLYSTFTISTDVELSLQAQGLIAADEVRELLSREHALIVAVNGKIEHADMHLVAGIDGTRRFLFPKALAQLDPELRAPFEKLEASSRYATMERVLTGYIAAQPVDMQIWRGLADPVLKEYTEAVWSTGGELLSRMEPAGVSILVQAAIAGALGLIAVVFSIFISVRLGRRITRELAGLRRTALDLSEIRLPDVVAKLRRGESVDIASEAPAITVGSDATSEVADLAAAFDSVQSTAVDAAVEQARMREGIAQALRNLARRSQSLLQRQLKLLDEMQRQTEEPEALEHLFKLDHLTTRMRRHAEGLVLLSGGSAGRRWRGTIPMEDVLSGSAAQIEEYTRVRVYPMPEYGVSGGTVADLMHLFAELIENATSFSAPNNEISVRGEMVGRGFAVEIEDRGLGMSEEIRRSINERLASPPDFDPAQTERLGFAVVGMLAAKHGIKVTLKPSPFGGTTAIVLVPRTLVEHVPAPVEPLRFESVSVSVVRPDTETTGDGELPRRVRTTKRGVTSPVGQPQEPVLPRRVRQTNLPQRQEHVSHVPEERSPEQTRALLSSLQSGWQRGRQDSDQDGGSQS
ncbi:sensor histidine kinase [Nonomuraea sp. NN258]|uniref:sensor histidine kinase n=1 Tax=Nonomuraea antri TaxID=2730852 RepID=UPI001C2C3012|nr:nitrate- and nitrite sensing domain-containing protein [Nonomuraea antri]NRQ32288.1 sensor histidine kinase [Nonomuraea antri]